MSLAPQARRGKPAVNLDIAAARVEGGSPRVVSEGRRVIDKTITLDVNGSTQRIRLCAERAGLPPLLIVQGGPALPQLNEVAKFQRGRRCPFITSLVSRMR